MGPFEIKTADDLIRARDALGWSANLMGRALRLAGGWNKAGARVLEMERGTKEITGPVSVAVEAFLYGFRPAGFDEHAGDR